MKFFLAQGSQVHLLDFSTSQLVAFVHEHMFFSDEKRTVHKWINKPYPICHALVKFEQICKAIFGSRKCHTVCVAVPHYKTIGSLFMAYDLLCPKFEIPL